MKTKTHTDERILAIAEPIAKDMGLNIVRVRVQSGRRKTVQIMAERITDGLLGIKECENLSRELTATLDVEDPIHDPFILEISSPGLERPLTSLEDFENYAGGTTSLDDLLGKGNCPSTGETAIRTNWVMEEMTKNYYS